MQLIRCDKCGCIKKPEHTKTLVVIPHEPHYINGMTKISLQENNLIPTKIDKELCDACWHVIMKKIYDTIS